jgi:hypothetical protein
MSETSSLLGYLVIACISNCCVRSAALSVHQSQRSLTVHYNSMWLGMVFLLSLNFQTDLPDCVVSGQNLVGGCHIAKSTNLPDRQALCT